MSNNKEQIYDTEIAPLMDQIIKICQENKIAMLASFSLPTEEDGSLVCSTALLAKAFDPPTEFREAMKTLYQPQ